MPLMGLEWVAGGHGGLAAAPWSRRFAGLGTKQTAIITVTIHSVAAVAVLYSADDYTTLLVVDDPAL